MDSPKIRKYKSINHVAKMKPFDPITYSFRSKTRQNLLTDYFSSMIRNFFRQRSFFDGSTTWKKTYML